MAVVVVCSCSLCERVNRPCLLDNKTQQTHQHHTIPQHTTPDHITLHHTTPHHTTPHHTTPHHTTPHHTTPHHTTPHHTIPHHTTPRHTTPHHTTPHYTTPHQVTPGHTWCICSSTQSSLRYSRSKSSTPPQPPLQPQDARVALWRSSEVMSKSRSHEVTRMSSCMHVFVWLSVSKGASVVSVEVGEVRM